MRNRYTADIWRRRNGRITSRRVQSPVIVFDHVTRDLAVLVTGPKPDKRIAELAESQREQVATSGRPGK